MLLILLDPAVMKKTGRILQTTDLAREYGFDDIDGLMPICTRTVSFSSEATL